MLKAYARCLSSFRGAPAKKVPSIKGVPTAILATIFLFSCEHAKEAITLALVCRDWRGAVFPLSSALKMDSVQGVIDTKCVESARTLPAYLLWEQLARRRWPHMSPNIRVKRGNWLWFFAARSAKLKRARTELAIENCSAGFELESQELTGTSPTHPPMTLRWKFRCPVAFSSLDRTDDAKIDYCSVCCKTVHLVSSVQELQAAVSEGRCVVLGSNLYQTRLADEQEMGLT